MVLVPDDGLHFLDPLHVLLQLQLLDGQSHLVKQQRMGGKTSRIVESNQKVIYLNLTYAVCPRSLTI